MLILQLFVFAEVVDVPELMEDGFQAVILSLCTAIANLVYTWFDIKNKSISLQENSSIFWLYLLTSNRKWVPFMEQIKKKDIQRSINFSNI
jgi:hypothetical protein